MEQQSIEESANLALSGGCSSASQGTPHPKAKFDRRLGMFVRIKLEISIFYKTEPVVAVIDEKPEVVEQDDHWDDELQQMLDDYD
jgi:hypothetical protein